MDQEDHTQMKIHAMWLVTIPHSQIQQMFNAGMHKAEENIDFYTHTDYLERRQGQWRGERQGKRGKTLNNALES